MQTQFVTLKRFAVAILMAAACFGQGKGNQVQTGIVDARGASWRFPESTFAGLPTPSAGNTGWRYTVTDCLTSACTAGGGSIKADLRSDGVSAWVVISGGGGSSQASVVGGGGSTTFQRMTECATGTVTLSGGTWTYPGGTAAAAAATTQEIPIVTSVPGRFRYGHVLISETTQFASGSVTLTKLSVGRPGVTTNDELLPQTSFMQGSGDSWFAMDRPQPPTLTGTYSLVLAIRTTGGNISALTAGAATYEVCGYAVQ
ncbi:MAG: hypothetical protein JWP63_2437 [Candidatus Solibacter sp.]|nr:hypothetical protein [Candidatus Solibacter sp.]